MAPIIQLVVWIINALTIVIFIRSILSWFIQDPYHPVMKLLIEVTEPILQPLRRVMPQTPGFDLTPFVAMLALQLLQRVIVSLLVV